MWSGTAPGSGSQRGHHLTAPKTLSAWCILCTFILALLVTQTSAQSSTTTTSSSANQPSTDIASQTPGQTTLATSTTSTALPTSTTSASIVDATSKPYVLTNGRTVRSSISISNDTSKPAYFSLPLAANETDQPIYVALSLCDGPPDGVVPRFASNASSAARYNLVRTAQVRLYVSIDEDNTLPGPDNVPDENKKEGAMRYALGGWAEMRFREPGSNANSGNSDVSTVSVGVWPPEWDWGVTGNFTIQLAVSTTLPLQTLQNNYGVALDDTDGTNALVTSFNYSSGMAPNISLVVLPTEGQYALSSIYYNSSFCAISDRWSSFLDSSKRPRINSSETTRGSTKAYADDDKRLQFQVSNLDMGTNYTAWLVSVNSTQRDLLHVPPGIALYPGIKFRTKRTETCRLVYDVPFCPQVAYSIPIGPGMATSQALSVINDTFTPNYSNFSKTISTFPCDDEYFGTYSSVRGCEDCTRAYQDWLCAVTMPRCTDPIEETRNSNFSQQSAANPDVDMLTGRVTGLNTNLLPYVLNRNGSTTGGQAFNGTALQVQEEYGEVLPCLYTCLFVQRNCPSPLVKWTCPQWDISAQADYGTFADSGAKGLGAAQNGGAGSDLSRWGGPLRYIAQDNFGNTYCSALGVDRFLREQNAARRTMRTSGGGLAGLLVAAAAVGVLAFA